MNPEDVLNPFIRRFDLPDSVVRLLYLLLQREIKKGYPSLEYSARYDRLDSVPMRFAKGLLHIFQNLPKIYDLDDSKLSSNIYTLAGFDDSDRDYLHSLCTRIDYYQYIESQRYYKEEINQLQRDIDSREKGENVSWTRQQLREAKDNLRNLKPPVDIRYLTQFWSDLVYFNVSFEIPKQTQFEHAYVLGATGTGKTQLLQFLIAQKVREGSVVVIDSQGDLIKNITRLKEIDPDRYVIIDPSDVEYPVALNIFDIGQERVSKYSQLEYERHTNGVIELLSYVFASILGAELTQRQGVALNFCLRLCLFIPNATIHTLRDLFSPNGVIPYKKYLENLTQSGQAFFANEFDNSKAFGDVKGQVLRRLYGILENPTIERLFTNPKSRFDMKEAMDSGKVILINTAKDLLKQQGCSFFGRFFISLVAQATQERASHKNRNPTYVFIDEAQDYLDTNISTLLEQSRKYNVSITLAHQQLSQLPHEIQSSILTNTSTKFIGGCSSSDARVLAEDMRTDSQTLINKDKLYFTTFIKGFTRSAITLKIKAGYMEGLPQRSDEEYDLLIANNRERISSLHHIHKEKKEEISTPDPGTGASME